MKKSPTTDKGSAPHPQRSLWQMVEEAIADADSCGSLTVTLPVRTVELLTTLAENPRRADRYWSLWCRKCNCRFAVELTQSPGPGLAIDEHASWRPIFVLATLAGWKIVDQESWSFVCPVCVGKQ
jgi:hypothetical protein